MRYYRIGKRRFDNYRARVGNRDELSAGGGELAFILKLIRNDAGDRRANGCVTQLGVNGGEPLLCLRRSRSRECAIVWIQRAGA